MPANVPASIEAEQALLGSMFLYPQTIELAFDEDLQPSDFFNKENRQIYQVILELRKENKPIDVNMVITRLTDLQQLDAVGGAEYILHLTDVAISGSNSEYYLSNIKEKSLLRKLIEVCENIRVKCYEGQYAPLDVLNEAESLVTKISRERKTGEFVNSKDAFAEVIQRINYLQTHQEITGVPSGYTYLDQVTNGFQNSDLIIIAARPSVGKTAFALNIAVNAATRADKTIAVFSLEMPVIQLAMRMLAAKASVESDKLRTGKYITNQDWAKIDEAIDKLGKANIYMDDSSSTKINDIFAKCRKLKQENGLDMIIIDYLQLVTPSVNRGDNRQQEVAEISRALKQLARELNVPVIALSQLNRSVERGERGKYPQLSDLRESGAIEQDADIVMFLHRDNEKNQNEDGTRKDIQDIKVIIAKHRNGGLANIDLAFDSKFNAFYTKQYSGDENEETE
ncbi:MAG: replicative DNA helicase [Erysipelotrichia bacterium]|nr:replicative DNA helicase [Erysipelotrichia bacterium]